MSSVACMLKRFLVEAYTPAETVICEIEKRARRAAKELSKAGTPVRYLHPIFIPEDEICFHLLDAATSAAAAEAIRRAGVAAHRISEAT